MENIFSQGEKLFAQGRMEQSEAFFLTLLDKMPSNPEVLNRLGVISACCHDLPNAIKYFTRSLEVDPLNKDAIINFCVVLKSLNILYEAIPYLETLLESFPGDKNLRDLLQDAQSDLPVLKNESTFKIYPWKLYYSPGIAHHGENARKLLSLNHYIPSLHYNEPTWFFGVYFDQDYLILQAHQGKKIINWRGADSWRMLHKKDRLKLIQETKALHVCQALHQKELLEQFGIKAIVRPMMNTPFHNITLKELPNGETNILVYWRSGDDNYIQADLFFKIVSQCRNVIFQIIGNEDALRFNQLGMENLIFHGYLSEGELDKLMDRCQGTIRPWVWDGNPNIQTKMLLKGRYAAHTCRFEKVAHCTTVEDYVQWINSLKSIREPNIEAREWWLSHLNHFDFLEEGFNLADA